MKKIEHIGIAVKDLSKSNRLYAKLLGVEHYKIECVKSEGVNTSFFKVGENKIELLEAMSPDSPIAKFIEKRGEGVHHIAFHMAPVSSFELLVQVSYLLAQSKELSQSKWKNYPFPKKKEPFAHAP